MPEERVGEPGGESLAAQVEDYLQWKREQGRAHNSLLLWRQKLRYFTVWLAGRDVTLRLLYDFRDHLQLEKVKPHREGRGCRPRTVHSSFGALAGYFDWLRLHQGVAGLPDVRAVLLPRKDPSDREVPTLEQVQKLYAAAEQVGVHARDPRYRAYLRLRALALLSLAAGCGLRRGEILALDVTDLRTDTDPWEVYVRQGKGAQSGWVPVGEVEREFLRAWLACRVGRLARLCQETPALLIDDKGRRMGAHSVETIMATLKALAGLEATRITLHGFRHAFGTLVMQTKDPKTAQALLRHASIRTTLEIYAHTDAARMREAVADVSRAIHTPEQQAPRASVLPPEPAGRRLSHAARVRRGARRAPP